MFLTHNLQSNGLLHHVTCPYTSNQNGMMESQDRRVVEKGLSLFLQASLPTSMWIHAFKTIVFTINRLHTKALNFQSPYHLLYSKMPDYSFLKMFGSLCFSMH